MKVGSIIAGRYELIAQLGEGGMGSVWRARRAGWPAEVAVKVIHAVLAQDKGAVERFRREARMAAELRGPNVVEILDDGVDEASQSPFLVMELLSGETLAGRLERCVRLAPRDTLQIVRQLENVLTSAHQKQMVHRDLKPENVFLTGPADAPIVKVLDFGVAKWGAESVRLNARTATGSVLGTPFYMSPEQLRDSSRVDFRCDLWGVGVMVFECLTGRRPFEADSLVELAIQICQGPRPVPSSVGMVPAGFDEWFARSASLDPLQRFGSAAELSETLSRVCAAKALVGALGSAEQDATLASPGAASPPGGAQSIGPLSSTRPAARVIRNQSRWVVGVAAAAMVVGGVAVLVWQGRVTSPREEPRSTALLPEPGGAQPASPASSPEAPSSPVTAAPANAKPASEPAHAVTSPVVSVLAAKPSPPAAIAPAAMPNVSSTATAGTASATPARAVAPAPNAPVPAVPAPAPAPGPGTRPKPSWDSSFERSGPKTPQWDPSFDRR